MSKFFYFLVYLTFLTTPLESVTLFKGLSIVKLSTIFLIGTTLIKRRKIFALHEPFFILFLIYTVLTILSSAWSIDKEATLSASLFMIIPSYIITSIIYCAIQNKVHLEKIFKAYVFGCGIVTMVSLYMYITGFRFEENSRLTVLGQDQNELSFLLSFGIVSIIYLIKYTKLKVISKLLLLILAFLYAFVVLTTGSRTGFVIMLFIIAILIIMSLRRGKVIYFAPVILIACVIFLYYLPASTTQRLFTTSDQIKSHDLSQRVEIWEDGLSAFNETKAYIFGTGFKTFRTLLDIKYNWNVAPHNTYLSTLIELGVVGLMIFLIMVTYLLRKVLYLCKNDSVFNILLIFPLILAMTVLGTETRRWLFLIGVLIIKISQFSKESAHISASFKNKI